MFDPSIDFPTVLSNALLTRSHAHVVIVEPVSTARMMMLDILRALGFTRLTGASNLREVVHYLESGPVDWIITPLLLDQPLNALKLLKLIIDNPILKNTAVSLIVNRAKESDHLCQAFELGALSWHAKPYAREEMQHQFELLLASLVKHEGHGAFVAAEYIREFLISRRFYRSLAAMEEELLALAPTSPVQMLALAEAEILDGRLDRGTLLLNQVARLDDSLAKLCEEMKSRYHSPDEPSLRGSFNSVVIIEPDGEALRTLKGLLEKIDVLNPRSFQDGDEAFAWIGANNNIDLILMEWTLPGVPGAVLLQRLRKILRLKTIIIVVGPVQNPLERPLLKEMGVDDHFEKPVGPDIFIARLSATLHYKQFRSKKLGFETRIRRLLAAKRTTEAQALLESLLKDNKVSDSVKKELHAEIEYQNHQYSKALALCVEGLKIETVARLGLLSLAGKCFMRLGQYESAVKCLERARELSPMNFERLLAIAGCRLALEQVEKADETLSIVRSQDSLNPNLIELETQVDLELKRKPRAHIHTLDLPALKRVAVYATNRGFALIKRGRLDEAKGIFERALNALPERKGLDLNLLTYNLALAYARSHEFEASLETLELMTVAKTSGLMRKKLAMEKRLKALLGNLEDRWPVLSEREEKDIAEEEDSSLQDSPRNLKKITITEWSDDLILPDIKKGDVGCYLIFKFLDYDHNQKFEKLGEPTQFQRRRGAPK